MGTLDPSLEFPPVVETGSSLKHDLNGTGNRLAGRWSGEQKFYSGISSRRLSLAHAPAEQLSEEAKPKQALFSHDGIDPPGRGKRGGNLLDSGLPW